MTSNAYEAYAIDIGFIRPRLLNSKKDYAVLSFEGLDIVRVRLVLGQFTNFAVNRFIFQLSESRAIRVDIQNKRLVLTNSVKSTQALNRTIKSKPSC